ncbi:acyl-CoA dehydratase activase-related protein [Ruegeria marisrubri]|uniref:acyl-CoA dehydratase activase-related protein n=1 Tax=Ruegeria marisrubri TaxID=1685379 RepID=UPI001CD3184B|nr:acyl-CoA dehydratase activase-related protein [Ruegeria marisrubri]MCA0907858.1 acyl-CoA dehydratase activase-related protein [Ruegeria marisrubri]
MPIQILQKAFAKAPFAKSKPPKRDFRIGIPRVLNQWSTHRFWTTLFVELGIGRRDIVYSSDTSEAQQLKFGKGRGAVDCCYPVKCMSGHYGELLNGQKRPIDILFVPIILTVPSFLRGHVRENMACPRVIAGPESTRAGFRREKDVFKEMGVQYLSPAVSLADPQIATRQLFDALKGVITDLRLAELRAAVAKAYDALQEFDQNLRRQSLAVLSECATQHRPCILALGRPYHMDTGIGHAIESELQAFGYPILWGQYLPLDAEILDWLYGDLIKAGRIQSPFDISDIWKTSHSANTNELLWAARYGSIMPWITCSIRFSSYECGMDQPTYSPVQEITEALGTLFFVFQDLDETKPAGSVRIRVETIAYYLEQKSPKIIQSKLEALKTAPPELLLPT